MHLLTPIGHPLLLPSGQASTNRAPHRLSWPLTDGASPRQLGFLEGSVGILASRTRSRKCQRGPALPERFTATTL